MLVMRSILEDAAVEGNLTGEPLCAENKKAAQESFPALFLRPVWVLVRVFQKMQKIGTPDRLLVLTIKIRKSKEKDWKSFDFQS